MWMHVLRQTFNVDDAATAVVMKRVPAIELLAA
jgi:hypothetical protein